MININLFILFKPDFTKHIIVEKSAYKRVQIELKYKHRY